MTHPHPAAVAAAEKIFARVATLPGRREEAAAIISAALAAAPDLLAALRAIEARVNGEWDQPDLVAFGALSTDTASDCGAIARRALLATHQPTKEA